MTSTREHLLEKALFRGAALTLANPEYEREVRATVGAFVRVDLAPRDLTVAALGIGNEPASAAIFARESGVAAGLEEWAFVLREWGVAAHFEKQDGNTFEPGDTLLRLDGERSKLLSLERAGLNLMQRMSGIASATRCLRERARLRSPSVRIVATRKTPWGLLDKRAVHLGGGGTHRIGLGDAILVKNNHLALLAGREEEAAPLAIERAWAFRKDSAFIEVEVRSQAAALAAARVFKRLQEGASDGCPCLLLLDNLAPGEIRSVLGALQRERLWDYTLVEASGGISEVNVDAYAECGVDAISVGALTHSARALDLCQKIS